MNADSSRGLRRGGPQQFAAVRGTGSGAGEDPRASAVAAASHLRVQPPHHRCHGGIRLLLQAAVCALRSAGAEDQLLATIRYIREKHPGLPVILDSKRGDIGSTAAKYAQESFERYGADAVTVNPYLGFDSVEPYLKWRIAASSCCAAPPTLARATSRTWNRRRQAAVSPCGRARGERLEWRRQLHAGDRRHLPAELAEIRSVVGALPFLVPGVVRRVAMSPPPYVPVAPRMASAWCSIHRAASSMRAAARDSPMQRAMRRARCATRSTSTVSRLLLNPGPAGLW